MDAVTSVTAAKMRALREAKKLGCSGAHQTEDGKWHPCASAEKLQRLRPGSTSSRIVVPPKSARTQRGANNIQRQWEPLGSRGIVAIDTITGGGLVSGVVGKAYQPASPRDEDPDVFTDIEAARDRSRQLGCIGVSRRISRSGRTIWMPCTNMTDLSNRTGRTYLGRRNIQKRTERFIKDTIRKTKPKAERQRKKSLHDDIHETSTTVVAANEIEVKRLGPKVGQRIGRGLRSAPNGFVFVDVTGAIDADKDGIVFEGKPLERPIIPRFIVPEGVGRRVSMMFQSTAIANEESRRRYGPSVASEIDPSTFATIAGMMPEVLPKPDSEQDSDTGTLRSMRSIFGNRRKAKLTQSKRREQIDGPVDTVPGAEPATDDDISSTSRRRARKDVSGVLRNIDEVTDEYEFYFGDDFERLIDEMVPTSNEELAQTLKNNPYTRNYARRLLKRISDAEPNYEAAGVVRDLLKKEARNNPAFIEGLRRYGMPPVLVTDYQPDVEGMGILGISDGGPSSWNLVMGGYASSGFIAFNPEALPDPTNMRRPDTPRGIEFRNIDVDAMLRHELAHAWEVMAAKQNPRSLQHYISSLAEMHENLKRGIKNKTDFEGGVFEPEYRTIYWGTKEERASARKISEYAETARIEWFAESFASYTDSDPSVRMKVDNVSIQNMADVLGMSYNEFITSFGQARRVGSMRSTRTPKHLDKLFGPLTPTQRDAIDWYNENPDYIDDAPLSIFSRLSPEALDEVFDVSFRSMRSASGSAVQARLSNDPETRIGQGALDALFARATGANRDGAQPTLWFLGGTTGSGKSQMRRGGLFVGVPSADDIPDIDPDEIKKAHPRWNGGKGALEVHRWSTRWTRYGRRQAMEQQRDHVVTGTGVRTEQLSEAKQAGYKTIGHFVYTPVDVAERRMKARAKAGGPDLPLYKAQGYSDDLKRSTTDAILRGDMDEFFLYDNGLDGANASLAVQQTADGEFEILNRRVFEAFFGRQNARRIEDYWNRNRQRQQSQNNSTPSSRSMRSSKMPPTGREFGKTLLRAKDAEGKDMRHARLDKTPIDFKLDLGAYDWSHSEWIGVDVKGSHTISGPFNGRFMNIKGSTWADVKFPEGSTFAGSRMELVKFDGADLRGVDFSGASLWGVTFTKNSNLENARFDNAVFPRAIFFGADLRNSGITIEQVRDSGIEWDDATQFPPDVQQFIDSLEETTQKVKNPRTGLYSLVNPLAETTTPIMRMFSQELDKRLRGRPRFRPILDMIRGQSGPIRGVELSRTSSIQEDVDEMHNKSFVSGFAQFASFVGTKLRGMKFIQMNADGIDASRTDIANTSFTSSSLRRARFIKAKVRSELSFRDSNLTDADFTDIEMIGGSARLNVKGARLMGAQLGKLPLSRVIYDDTTEWTGAEWEIDVLPNDLRNKGIRQTRMRSMRGGTSRDTREALSSFNDAIINWSSLDRNEKQTFAYDFNLAHRDLLETRENSLSANSALRASNQKLKELNSRLERLTEVLGASGPSMVDIARNGNRQQFVNAFRSAKQANPDFARGKTARMLFNDIGAMFIDLELERTNNNFLREYKDNEREKSQSLESLRSLLNDDTFSSESLKKPTGTLRSGQRSTEPLVPGSESLRSNRRINLQDAQSDEIDTIAKGTGDKDKPERLYRALIEAQAALKDQLGRPISAAPGIGDEEGARMRDSIRIEIAPNRMPMLIAQPFKAIADELPDKRDWSTVLAPSLDDARNLAKAILQARKSRKPLPIQFGFADRDRINEQLYGIKAFQTIIDKIVSQLDSSNDDWPEDSDSFVDVYLAGIRNPRQMQRLPGSDGVHDFFGHFGIGRGFDRHGEFAAALATDSLLRDHPEFGFFTPEEREVARREFFHTGVLGFSRIRDNARLEFEQKHGISFHGGASADMSPEQLADRDEILQIFGILEEEIADVSSANPHYLTLDEILDVLGVPPSTTRVPASTESPSMRSARRSTPLIDVSDEVLLSVAQQEADTKLDRSMRSVRGRRPMTDDERARFKPLNLEPDQKIKLQPGTTLIYANEDDEIIRTELIGPQVARLRGTPRMKLYIDPNPNNQDEIDLIMERWEKEFGPVSSPSRQARGRSQPDRQERSRNQPQQQDEDPLDKILREVEEYEARKRESTRSQRTRVQQGSERPTLSTLVPKLRTIVGDDGKLQIDPRDKKRLIKNHVSIIDNLKSADIPENYKISRHAEQKIRDDIEEFQLTNGSPLSEDKRQKLIQDMRLKFFKQDIRMAILRDSIYPNDDGTLSAEMLPDGEPQSLFGQASIANLTEGQSVFVTDIPATPYATATKNAIVSRINGMLVMTELTDRSAERLKKHLSSQIARDPISGASVTTFDDLLEVSHFPGAVTYNQLDETKDAISRFADSISDVRGDIPKPNVVLKQDYALYPPGSGLVMEDLAGLANQGQGAITFFRTSRYHIGLLPLTHEWGHFLQNQLEKRGIWTSRERDEWQMAMLMDRQVFSQNEIPKGQWATARIPAGPKVTHLKDIHTPKINSASVTDYGKTNEGEDWAESVALFLIDKTVGYLLQEADSNDNPIEGGRRLRFAQLYPQRAQMLERLIKDKPEEIPQWMKNDPNLGFRPASSLRSQSTPSYDKRFKDSYGSNIPSGDGDCFVAARDMLTVLQGNGYGFTSEQIRLVHGTPLGTGGEADGIRFPHAWVEVNENGWEQYEELRGQLEVLRREIDTVVDQQERRRTLQALAQVEARLSMESMNITVFDHSNGNEFSGPRVLYYAIGNIREQDSRYYSSDDADDQMSRNEHYGPWE